MLVELRVELALKQAVVFVSTSSSGVDCSSLREIVLFNEVDEALNLACFEEF